MRAAADKRISVDFDVDGIPLELRARRQWVCWNLEVRRNRSGQLVQTKVPMDPNSGRRASSTDPGTWATFDHAVRVAGRRGWGIGFVFSKDDPFSGIDLDNCRHPATGAIAAWAHGIIRHFASYTEVSPSGTGVKIVIKAMLSGCDGRRRGGIELYSAKRFFCLTGTRSTGLPAQVCARQRALNTLVAQLFPPLPPTQPRRGAVPEIADDAELVARAQRARNGAKFSMLWRGDWAGAGYGSQSEADAALVALIGFWTPDPARIDAIFRQSGLCRTKWTERADYRRRTIERVLH